MLLKNEIHYHNTESNKNHCLKVGNGQRLHKPLCVPQLHESNIVINLRFLLKIASNFVFVSVSESPLQIFVGFVLWNFTCKTTSQVSRLRSYMDREGDKILTDCLGAKKLRPPKPKGTKQGEKKQSARTEVPRAW